MSLLLETPNANDRNIYMLKQISNKETFQDSALFNHNLGILSQQLLLSCSSLTLATRVKNSNENPFTSTLNYKPHNRRKNPNIFRTRLYNFLVFG